MSTAYMPPGEPRCIAQGCSRSNVCARAVPYEHGRPASDFSASWGWSALGCPDFVAQGAWVAPTPAKPVKPAHPYVKGLL